MNTLKAVASIGLFCAGAVVGSHVVNAQSLQAPTVSYLGPSSASVGDTVYVYGTNFDSATFVGLDGNNGTAIHPSAITLVSPTELSFAVPSSLGVGAHTLAVAEMAGPWSLSSPVSFNVVATPQAPTATSATSTSQMSVVIPPVPTHGVTSEGNGGTSIQALQQELVQLITSLLQLLEKAAAQGLLSPSQLNAALNTLSPATQ